MTTVHDKIGNGQGLSLGVGGSKVYSLTSGDRLPRPGAFPHNWQPGGTAWTGMAHDCGMTSLIEQHRRLLTIPAGVTIAPRGRRTLTGGAAGQYPVAFSRSFTRRLSAVPDVGCRIRRYHPASGIVLAGFILASGLLGAVAALTREPMHLWFIGHSQSCTERRGATSSRS